MYYEIEREVGVMTIGERIKQRREELNLSQEELYMLFINIRNVFAEYDETKYLVSENDIQIFVYL